MGSVRPRRRPVATFLGLSPRERLLLLQALFWVIVVRMGLTALPFRRLTTILPRLEGRVSRVSESKPSTPMSRAAPLSMPGGATERGVPEAAVAARAEAHRAAVAAVTRQVTRASRRVPRATCLTQALAARLMLARRDVPVRVLVGVIRDSERGAKDATNHAAPPASVPPRDVPDDTGPPGPGFQAHAWVIHEGATVLGASAEAFVPLLSIGGPRGAWVTAQAGPGGDAGTGTHGRNSA